MSDFELINNWSQDDIYELCYKVLDVCCDTNILDLNYFTSKTITNYDLKLFHDNADNNKVVLEIFDYFVRLFGTNIQEDIIESRLDDVNLSENVKTIVMECYKVQKLRLFKTIVYRVAHNSNPCLENYDWSLFHVISTNQMSDMRTTIIKLSLVVEQPNHNVLNSEPKTKDTFTFELTKDELLEFIEFLQQAQKDLMEQLKTSDPILKTTDPISKTTDPIVKTTDSIVN